MIYWWIIAFTVIERLVELIVSQRNAAWSFARGGREIGADHYKWMVMLHTSYLFACVIEPLVFDRQVNDVIATFFMVVVILTQLLRWWVILTLGHQWNTRVIIVPGLARVKRGPFLWFDHPNYLAVIVELAALPLIHGAWLTSVIYSALNLWLLKVRISIENKALAQLSSS